MPSASLMNNKSFGLQSACSSFMEIDNKEVVKKHTEKQGIVTILGSDVFLERGRAASLRRTLSADMSSKKWLAQNGFSPMKKTASSEELSLAVIPDSLSSSSSSEGEEENRSRGRRHGKFNIWSSAQDENKNKEVEKPGLFDIWSSIISQKANEGEALKPVSPPYIHPLVKRSASTLSENSLKICTESLGSETGSDGFSSYPVSESETSSDVEVTSEDKEEDQQSDQKQPQIVSDIGEEYYGAVKLNNHHGGGSGSTRKSVLAPPRSFPPPIPSLSHSDGSSLRMQTRRDNGRLVLEAVSVHSHRNFHADRQDGRLVLTFLNTITTTSSAAVDDVDDQESEEEFDEKFVYFEEDENEENSKIDDDDDDDEDDDDEEEEEEEEAEEEESGDEEVEVEKRKGMAEVEIEMEEAPKLSINFHRLALMMSNKPIGLASMKQPWPRKFNEAAAAVKLEEDDDDDHHHHHHHHQKKKQMVPTAQSLPPRPPPPAGARMIPSSPVNGAKASAATAASFNAYEYYWRGNSTATTTHHVAMKPLERNTNTIFISKNELMANHEDDLHEHQNLVVLRGNKADDVVPLLKSCKKPRSCTSLLFWEPHCIATS